METSAEICKTTKLIIDFIRGKLQLADRPQELRRISFTKTLQGYAQIDLNQNLYVWVVEQMPSVMSLIEPWTSAIDCMVYCDGLKRLRMLFSKCSHRVIDCSDTKWNIFGCLRVSVRVHSSSHCAMYRLLYAVIIDFVFISGECEHLIDDAESFKNGQTDGTTDVIETISNHANYNYVEDDDDEDDGNFISYEELKIQHELEMAEQRRKNAIISIDESDDDLENNEFNDGEYEYVDSNKPHICKVCLKQVANRYNLKRHMMIHTGERPYGCDMCTKRFREFCDLKKHRRVHWMENGYICMVCYENAPTVSDSTKCQTCMDQEIVQKKIATVSYIEYPRMEGTKKMYNCPVCHRIFGSSHNLKRHTMIHTGEKPYKCDTCHRAFREHSTLRKHQLTHSQGVYIHGDALAPNSTTTTTTTIDNNLYKCELCGKRFLSSTNLSEHIQLTHSEMVVNIVSNEVHPCHICSRNFRTNQHLQSHMITHS